MDFYRARILPTLCDRMMRNEMMRPYRARVAGAAEGRVLEIGAGSGLNFRYCRPSVGELVAL